MRKGLAAIWLLMSLAGCSMLDAINPFASNGPEMAELAPFTASAEARVLWQERAGKSGIYSFSPAVVGSTVYAAGRDGSLIRVDDGKPGWKIKVEQTLSGGVAADARMVVVGTSEGDVLAFASADGAPLWKTRVSSEVLAPPAIAEGLVVVRSGDNRLTAFDALDGTLKWIYQRPSPSLALRTSAPSIIEDKYVFSGFPGGKLIAVSTSNGAALWEGTVALPKGSTELDRVADITSPPVIVGRTICAVSFQGRVACFDLGNGSLLWSRDMSSSVGLAMDSNQLYVTDDDGAVHALNLTSGASVWKQDKLHLRRLTAPVARRGLIAVADAEGVVHFLRREDGAFAARLATDGSPVVAPLQVLGTGLVAQTTNGGIYAIEAE